MESITRNANLAAHTIQYTYTLGKMSVLCKETASPIMSAQHCVNLHGTHRDCKYNFFSRFLTTLCSSSSSPSHSSCYYCNKTETAVREKGGMNWVTSNGIQVSR